MEMPKIKQCAVTECAYNADKKCHAMAITVGDAQHPVCDTFCQSDTKGGDASRIASVGACKVMMCKFNMSLECEAPGISVGRRGKEVDCLTYEAR
jgi:hypothetical protein